MRATTPQASILSAASSTQPLLAMATGFWISRALYVAAKLGIADLIGDHARAPEYLARRVQVDADAPQRRLRSSGRASSTPSSTNDMTRITDQGTHAASAATTGRLLATASEPTK